jgi:hypothetical protein
LWKCRRTPAARQGSYGAAFDAHNRQTARLRAMKPTKKAPTSGAFLR